VDRALQTPTDDDDDRRQRAKQQWPIRRASNEVFVKPLLKCKLHTDGPATAKARRANVPRGLCGGVLAAVVDWQIVDRTVVRRWSVSPERLVKFCKHVGYVKYQHKDDKSPLKGAWSVSPDPFLILLPIISLKLMKLGISNISCTD